MPYTFGAAVTNRITVGMAVAPSATVVLFTYGWWYPTTLTAGRALWGNGSITSARIDTTTTQLRFLEDHVTTDAEWTTSDAGLTVNQWFFAAFLWTPVNAGGAVRAWVGTPTTPPSELTVSSAVAASGNFSGNGNIAVGNTSGSLAFQGDVAEFGYLSSAVAGSNIAPIFIGTAGTISNNESDLAYRRLVLPAWGGRFPDLMSQSAGSGATAVCEASRIVLNTLPVVQQRQSGSTTLTPSLAPTITGATVSLNGHPRPPLSSQLFYPSRRR